MGSRKRYFCMNWPLKEGGGRGKGPSTYKKRTFIREKIRFYERSKH